MIKIYTNLYELNELLNIKTLEKINSNFYDTNFKIVNYKGKL